MVAFHSPKIDVSKVAERMQNDITQQFSKGLSTGVKSAALSILVSVGEQAAQQFIKSMSEGASKALTTRLAGQDSAIGKIGETLIATVLDQIQKSAVNQLKSATGGVSQNISNATQVPVRSATPALPPPVHGPAAPQTYRPSAYEKPPFPGAVWDNNAAQWMYPRNAGPPAPPAPPAQSMWQRAVSMGSGIAGAGRSMAGGPVGTAATFWLSEHSIGSAIGSAQTALQTNMELSQTLAALQKTIGDASTSSKSFVDRIRGVNSDLGTLPTDAASAASIFLPAARRGTVGNISQLMHFASGYGLSSDAWASQMAQAAGLGLVGGAQGSTGMGQYQAMLAQAFAGTSGIAKMGDFTTGFQDLARIIQANTGTTQNPNNALQLYTALNKTGIAGLSGTSGAAILGQLNQGIVNGPTSGSAAVQMAYFQALGGKNGISPSALRYQTEEGLSGKAFGQLLSYSNKAYAGYSPMDKLYAQSQLFGLNMHQTQQVIKAYGSGNNGFSMQGLYNLVGGKSHLNNLNDSQLNLLTQLAAGKKTKVASEMVQENVYGASAFFKHHKNYTDQQLANLIMKGGTPQSADVQSAAAQNAFQKALQKDTEGLMGLYTGIKLFGDGLGALGGTLTMLAGIRLGKSLLSKLLPSAAGDAAEGAAANAAAAGAGAAGGRAGVLARLGGKFARLAPAARALGAGAAAVGTEEFLFGQNNAAMEQYAKTHKGWKTYNAGGVLGYLEGGDIAYSHAGGPTPLDWLDTHWGLNPAVGSAGLWQPAINPVQALASLGLGGWNLLTGRGAAVPHHGGGIKMPRGGSSSVLPTSALANLSATDSTHLQALGDIYFAHTKAANLLVEQTQQKGLSIYAPLPERTIRQLSDNLSTFLQNYGKSLTDWQQAALGAIPSPGAPGGIGGPGGNPGAFPGGGGSGRNTFAGFAKGNPYGAVAAGIMLPGPNGTMIQDVERGQIFSAAAGTPIDLPQGAKYDRNLSDQYRSIFTLPNGRALSFMHGNMSQNFKNGQYLKAGTQIGTVAPNSGTYYGTTPTGARTTYKSTPDIVEFGVYDNPQDAFTRNVPFSHTYDPNKYLASLGGSGSGSGGAGYPSWMSITKGGATAYLRNSQYIRDYVNASRKYGVPLSALVAQGFQESGWNKDAYNPQAVANGEHAVGIAQFLPSTARSFGINPRNPDQSIDAQARYMAQLMASNGGLAGAWNAYGTGDISALQHSFQMGGSAQGGSSSSGPSGTFEAEITLKYPGGVTEKQSVTFRPKYAGVPYTHEGHQAKAMGGRAPRR